MRALSFYENYRIHALAYILVAWSSYVARAIPSYHGSNTLLLPLLLKRHASVNFLKRLFLENRQFCEHRPFFENSLFLKNRLFFENCLLFENSLFLKNRLFYRPFSRNSLFSKNRLFSRKRLFLSSTSNYSYAARAVIFEK